MHRATIRGAFRLRGEALAVQAGLTALALGLCALVALRVLARSGRPAAPRVASAGMAVTWEEAEKRIGQVVTFEGRIVAAKNTGSVCFLNFHPDYKNHVAVVIFASDFHRFPDASPERAFQGRRVRVTGLVESYKGRSEVKVRDAGQIEVIP